MSLFLYLMFIVNFVVKNASQMLLTFNVMYCTLSWEIKTPLNL